VAKSPTELLIIGRIKTKTLQSFINFAGFFEYTFLY